MTVTTDGSLSFPILIGDIGGTNARFALLADAVSEPVFFPIMGTEDFETIEDAIEAALTSTGALRPRSAILAVAGPIQADDIPLTNADWVIRPKDMLRRLGLGDVIVINDFEAQALAVTVLTDSDRDQIGLGAVRPSASRAVLGPGTGLGVAGLIHDRQRWIPVPGEGGHVDLGPRTTRDYQIWPHLETIEGRVAAEQVLCGRGIVNLYTAICLANGNAPVLTEGLDKGDQPAAVTTAGLADSNPEAVETLSLFSACLGRVAGDMALVFMARGGVFLAGGISQKILPALRAPAFRAAFEDKAPHSALLRSIPTFVVTHPMAALAGLAAFSRAPASYGVATEGRRWRS